MNPVSSAVTQTALSQLEVRNEIAISVMKLARDTQKESAQMTLQALEAVSQSMEAGRLDVYG
jgi:hypothetical protein